MGIFFFCPNTATFYSLVVTRNMLSSCRWLLHVERQTRNFEHPGPLPRERGGKEDPRLPTRPSLPPPPPHRYLSKQFISRRSPCPLDSHRSDMTDQDKWSGSEVRSIQSSDCPRQEQKGHTVNKAQLTSVLPQRPFGFCEVNIKGEEKKKKMADVPIIAVLMGDDIKLDCRLLSSPHFAFCTLLLASQRYLTSTRLDFLSRPLCACSLSPCLSLMDYFTFYSSGFQGLSSARLKTGLQSSSAAPLLSPHLGRQFHYRRTRKGASQSNSVHWIQLMSQHAKGGF